MVVRAREALLQLAVARKTHPDRGASLVEYALLVALIALVCFVAVEFVGGSADSSFSDTGASVAAAN